MTYDINKLRALRDNIDAYLRSENQRDDQLRSILNEAVAEQTKSIKDEIKQYIDERIGQTKQKLD